MFPPSAHHDKFSKGLDEQLRTELKLIESKVRMGEFPTGVERKTVSINEESYNLFLIPFHGLTIICRVVPGGFVFIGPFLREKGELVPDHQALEKLKPQGLKGLS